MRCKACAKEVSPKTSIKIGHTAVTDYVRLCDGCFAGDGHEVVEQRFGSLMTSKPSERSKNSANAGQSPSAGVHYDVFEDNERARESRQRGIERSREMRGAS